MRQVTNDFRNALIQSGRELDAQIIYTLDNTTITLTSEDINSVNFSYKGSLLKSTMRQLEIDSNRGIPVNTDLEYRIGVKVGDSYEYISYNHFIVKKVEMQENTSSFIISCEDRMTYAMKDYENSGIVYPITIRNYINAICIKLGLIFKNVNSTFVNYDKVLTKELYLDEDGNSLYYTFRDVLDELAEVTASVICINESDGELEVRYLNNTNHSLDNNYLKDTNVKANFKIYGPINSVTLSRSADTDQIYEYDELSMRQYGETKIKIVDNQILNGEDREQYLTEIFNALNGIRYTLGDFSSFGILYFDIMDYFEFFWIDPENPGVNHWHEILLLNDEIIQTQGLEENIVSEKPLCNADVDLSNESKQERKDNRATLIVDKVKGEIDAKVSKDGIIADLNLAIEDGQGIIRATGNTFILDADNASIDAQGNAEFNDATLRGGSLDLLDDGTQEESSIKIHNLINVLSIPKVGMDISNKIIYLNTNEFAHSFYLPYGPNVTILSTDTVEFKMEVTSSGNTGTANFYYIYNNNRTLYASVPVTKTTNYESENVWMYNDVSEFTFPVNSITIPADGGEINNIVTIETDEYGNYEEYDENFKLLFSLNLYTTTDKVNNINSHGLSTNVTPKIEMYTDADYILVMSKLGNEQQFTEDEIKKYDLDNDGEVTYEDLKAIQMFRDNYVTSNNPIVFKIDTQNIKNNVLIYDEATGNKVTMDIDKIRLQNVDNPEEEYGSFLELTRNGLEYVSGYGNFRHVVIDDLGISVNNKMVVLENEHYYSSGDYTFNSFHVAGCVTGSTQQVVFTIPVGLSLKNIRSITAVSGSVTVRGTAGYVEGSGTSPYLSMTNTSSYTYTCSKSGDYYITIGIAKKSGTLSNVTNNTPVTVLLRSVKLRFTE